MHVSLNYLLNGTNAIEAIKFHGITEFIVQGIEPTPFINPSNLEVGFYWRCGEMKLETTSASACLITSMFSSIEEAKKALNKYLYQHFLEISKEYFTIKEWMQVGPEKVRQGWTSAKIVAKPISSLEQYYWINGENNNPWSIPDSIDRLLKEKTFSSEELAIQALQEAALQWAKNQVAQDQKYDIKKVYVSNQSQLANSLYYTAISNAWNTSDNSFFSKEDIDKVGKMQELESGITINNDPSKPSQDKPSQDKPSQDKPSQDKPSQDKPSHSKFKECTFQEWIDNGTRWIANVIEVNITDKQPKPTLYQDKVLLHMDKLSNGDDPHALPYNIFKYLLGASDVYVDGLVFENNVVAKKSLNLACLLWAYSEREREISQKKETEITYKDFCKGSVVQLKSGGKKFVVTDANSSFVKAAIVHNCELKELWLPKIILNIVSN